MADSLMEFEAIYVRYHPKIVRYLARFVGWHEAEDLSQEVFVKVGRSLASFRGAALAGRQAGPTRAARRGAAGMVARSSARLHRRGSADAAPTLLSTNL